MNLTTESFLGTILIMIGVIMATGHGIPYYMLSLVIGIILLLKGIFLILDDIVWHNRWICRILSLFFSI